MNSTSETNESQSLRRFTRRIIDDFLKGKEKKRKKKKKMVKRKEPSDKKLQKRKRGELKKKETRVRNAFTTYVVLDTSVLSVRVQWPPFPLPLQPPSTRHSFLSICIRKLSRRKFRFSSVPFLSFSIDTRKNILIIIKIKISFLDHQRSNDPTYPSSFPNSHLVWLFICL